ncbi:hypothetical protein XENOCAPTIV_013850 [Xenoophorus captivus]|uniref:Uncharacterized protein n=1 Tax=Xenoophorus captivus TaxID=1517983 RepID=A0ABV0RLG5_9TELE
METSERFSHNIKVSPSSSSAMSLGCAQSRDFHSLIDKCIDFWEKTRSGLFHIKAFIPELGMSFPKGAETTLYHHRAEKTLEAPFSSMSGVHLSHRNTQNTDPSEPNPCFYCVMPPSPQRLTTPQERVNREAQEI